LGQSIAGLLKKIRRIQYQTSYFADDIFAGAYRSAFKGKGMEFEDVREYISGDDVRVIDWNVTARMNRLYVKNFREEREMTLTLLVDVSSSTLYGSGMQSKAELIAEIAGTLGFSAIKNQDKVALILFTDRIVKYLPPKSGSRHILRIIRELLVERPDNSQTDINTALAFLGKVSIHPGICFILSDFMSPDFSHQAALIAKRHDLISLMVVDPFEFRLPKMGLLTVRDLESGACLAADTNSEEFQQELNNPILKRIKQQQELMNHIGAGFVLINSGYSYLHPLKKFFHSRQMRRR